MFKKAFKIFLTAFLFLSIIGVFTFLFQASRYNRWKSNEFEEKSEIICLDQLYREKSFNEMEEEIAEKIKTFTLSDNRTDFVVLTKKEILHVLSSNIEPLEPFVVEGLCIYPSQGLWSLYTKYRVGNLRLPFIVMDVVKDNRETAELYVNDVRVGDVQLPRFIGNRVMTEFNRGISDAVIMLNENRFLGRVIENIELLEERVVFKGSI